jgi:hypothetical protein
MSKKRQGSCSRLTLLRSNSFALCRNGHGLQAIVEVFQQSSGTVLALECGCRRQEEHGIS